jgi:rfaE bifunctional protein nucleotidyltransferase chain/domain
MLKSKIKSISQLKKIIPRLRKKGNKIVFTNGCFDLLHAGHVKYLEDARRKGDILVVAINSDASVRRIKGNKRPVINENDRLTIIGALASVDYVFLFKEDTPLKVIKQVRPDILVKGADWEDKTIVGSNFVKSYGGRVSTIKFINGRSTSSLIKKIVQTFYK